MRVHTKVNEVLNELSGSIYTHPISVHPGVGEILYSLARNLKPRTVVEIGCFIGYSSICFAQAMEDNGQDNGTVYGIDLFQPHIENPLFLKESIDNPLQLAENNVKKAGLEHRITFIKGSASLLAKDFLNKIENIDILFIDGDHSYKGVIDDYNLYHPRVRKGGLIVFHDIFPKKCGWWGPRILIDILKWKRYEILEVDTPDGFGLAICRKLFAGGSNVRTNVLIENFRKAYSYYKEGGNFKELYRLHRLKKNSENSRP